MIRLTLIACLCCTLQAQTRYHFSVETGLPAGTPVTAQIDVSLTNRQSFVLKAGKQTVPFRLSEALERGAAGQISWVVSNPRQTEYDLVLTKLTEPYRPPVGVGDTFHFNRLGGFDPLTAGMKNDQAIAVDWDGDGNTDLLQRNIYSNALGEPQWGIYFWRNIATNKAPRFDRFVRLSADGAPIADPYASFQVTDWDGDGLLDLLVGVGSGPQKAVLKVYRNTGQRDPRGLPVLVSGSHIPWSSGGEFTYGMRLFQWAGALLPDLFTLRMKVQYFPPPEMDSTLYRHRREGQAFSAGEALQLAGSPVYDDWPSTMFDVNGDGLPDFVGATRGLQTKPVKTCIVAWENTGSLLVPAYSKQPTCIIDVSPEGFAIPSAASAPGFDGLLVGFMGGWLQYYQHLTGSKWAQPQVMLARGMPVSSGGYSTVEVADWEGDGDLDFIIGNEVGFVQLIENVSSSGRVMFKTPRKIPLTDNTNMYAGRWQFIDDADPERPLGQSKPAYVDWDGDGDLDMLVGNNSNRIAYFENAGTRQQPRFSPMRALVHDGGEHFSFRARPAPVDWNGDGLMDLVAGYAGARDRNDPKDIAICLYRRYRDAAGKLRLGKPEVFKLTNGQEMRTPIPYHHGFEVVDWEGDGDFDILANERTQLVLYRNMGTNAKPAFQRELLQLYGQPLSVSHHETSMKAVDWDHDGKLDLITGGESGMAYYFHRSALEMKQPPKVRVTTYHGN